MKTKRLFTLALAALTIGLLGSCKKDNVYIHVPETPKAPEGALAGKFTVNAVGKQVYFSKGNLYADGSKALHFEDAQWKSTPTSNGNMDASHVSHFTWSSTVEAAVGNTNSGDNLFCDESHKVSVDGGEAIYYALSKDEWVYLFNTRTMTNGKARYTFNISYGGKMGLVLYPDDYSGSTLTSGTDYTDANFPADCVFLPAAGGRIDPNVEYVGDEGHYWSSTAKEDIYAHYVKFSSDNVHPDDYFNSRGAGSSVRLVTEVK